MAQDENPDSAALAAVATDDVQKPIETKKKSSLWMAINAVLSLATIVWIAATGPPDTELSGWSALYCGLLILSLAGESIYSRRLFTRLSNFVLTPEAYPKTFWLIASLMILAGIRCVLLAF